MKKTFLERKRRKNIKKEEKKTKNIEQNDGPHSAEHRPEVLLVLFSDQVVDFTVVQWADAGNLDSKNPVFHSC